MANLESKFNEILADALGIESIIFQESSERVNKNGYIIKKGSAFNSGVKKENNRNFPKFIFATIKNGDKKYGMRIPTDNIISFEESTVHKWDFLEIDGEVYNLCLPYQFKIGSWDFNTVDLFNYLKEKLENNNSN